MSFLEICLTRPVEILLFQLITKTFCIFFQKKKQALNKVFSPKVSSTFCKHNLKVLYDKNEENKPLEFMYILTIEDTVKQCYIQLFRY